MMKPLDQEFIENYIDNIKKIIPLISASATRGMSGRLPVRDIVSLQGDRTDKPLAGSRDGIADIVFKKVGHIPANPTHELNTRMLRESYVFASESPSHIENDAVVNRSKEVAMAFIQELIEAAKIERDRALATTTRNRDESIGGIAKDSKSRERFFVLRGARGIGKTYFLNYLLSEFAQKLDQQRVIWVRINLPTSREFDERLDHWVEAQTTKILVRYYDKESDFSRIPKKDRISVIEHLRLWAGKYSDADSRPNRIATVERICDVFAKRGSDRDISPEIVPIDVAAEVRRYALSQGLAFVVVFDGFDRLDYDAKNQKRFNRLVQGLERLATGSANANAVYLCVSRTHTFKHLWSTNPFVRFRKNTVYVISESPVSKILNERISALEKWATSRQAAGDRDAPRLLMLLQAFRKYVEDRDNECKLDEIDRVLGQNIRGKTQIVQFLFLEFLAEENEMERYRYRLVEYLATAGRELPPVIYDYFISNGTEIQSEIIATTDYDTRLLPIVFRPIVPRDTEGNRLTGKFLTPGSLLHTARILQILEFDQRFMSHRSRAAPISVIDIVEICERWFNFSPLITRTLIQELETYELCMIARQFYIDAVGDHSGVRLAPKGTIFLDSMIFDVAYLNLAAMRILFSAETDPKDFVTLCPRPNGYTESDKRKGIARWIRSKIRNSITMLGLMQHANEVHRGMLESYRPLDGKETIERDFWNEGAGSWMLSTVNNWTTQALHEIGIIVNSSINQGHLSEDEANAVLKMIQSRMVRL